MPIPGRLPFPDRHDRGAFWGVQGAAAAPPTVCPGIHVEHFDKVAEGKAGIRSQNKVFKPFRKPGFFRGPTREDIQRGSTVGGRVCPWGNEWKVRGTTL